MKTAIEVMVLVLLLALFLVTNSAKQVKLSAAPAFSTPSPLLVDPDQQFAAQIAKSIDLSQPRISAARKTVINDIVKNIAEKVFDQPEHRSYWVALLGVESRYEGTAKSATGAVGIGQLIPSYREDFGKDCGVTDVSVADLSDDYTNAYLSACYFRSLIKANAGNIPLALVAYNGGINSKGYQAAKLGGSPSRESAAYVTRVVVKKARADGK